MPKNKIQEIPKVSPWDLFLKKIVTQPIEEIKDREIIAAARELAVELRMKNYKLSTEI